MSFELVNYHFQSAHLKVLDIALDSSRYEALIQRLNQVSNPALTFESCKEKFSGCICISKILTYIKGEPTFDRIDTIDVIQQAAFESFVVQGECQDIERAKAEVFLNFAGRGITNVYDRLEDLETGAYFAMSDMHALCVIKSQGALSLYDSKKEEMALIEERDLQIYMHTICKHFESPAYRFYQFDIEEFDPPPRRLEPLREDSQSGADGLINPKHYQIYIDALNTHVDFALKFVADPELTHLTGGVCTAKVVRFLTGDMRVGASRSLRSLQAAFNSFTVCDFSFDIEMAKVDAWLSQAGYITRSVSETFSLSKGVFPAVQDGLYFVRLWQPVTHGHSLALKQFDGTILFYDPNFGDFQTKDPGEVMGHFQRLARQFILPYGRLYEVMLNDN